MFGLSLRCFNVWLDALCLVFDGCVLDSFHPYICLKGECGSVPVDGQASVAGSAYLSVQARRRKEGVLPVFRRL